MFSWWVEKLIEVEVKIPVEDLSVVRDLLDKIGGIKKWELSRIKLDAYYNHPCRNFSVTDEALRVRDSDGRTHSLTYKGPKLSLKTKTRVEINLQLSNGDLMNDILEKLGFVKVASITKSREWWRLRDSNVYLDEVEDLGNFIEVEHEVEDEKKIKEAENRILKLIKLLRLSAESVTRKSYLELFLEKRMKFP